jgi:spermidine synthase
MVRCLWAILPAALLWGASFPLALAAAAHAGGDSGRLVGGIYAANTGGAILGALTFSLILVPTVGTGRSQSILIAIAAVSGLFALAPLAIRPFHIGHASAVAVACVAAVLLVQSVSPVPGMLIAYGRRMMTSLNRSKVLFTGEGINSSIAITEWDDGAIQFHVSGKVEASTESYDMRLQRMLGHMPALMHNDLTDRDLRDGAADYADRNQIFRPAELRSDERQAHADHLRRRAPLRADYA